MWITLEERQYYATAKDGSEVWVELDIEGDVYVINSVVGIINTKFTNIKIVLEPNSYDSEELKVIGFENLGQWINNSELIKMITRANEQLLEYGKELLEEQTKI